MQIFATDFNKFGELKPGNYQMSLSEIYDSILVKGPSGGHHNWDRNQRERLLNNFSYLIEHLWKGGWFNIYIGGSYTTLKASPGDIDCYFEAELRDLASGKIVKKLKDISGDPNLWIWSPESMTMNENGIRKIPMWHKFYVEIYPHTILKNFAMDYTSSGFLNERGEAISIAEAFRRSYLHENNRGVIQVIK